MRTILFFALIGFMANCWAGIWVDDLSCEFSQTPMTVDTQHPRLSWVLQADEPDQCQTAFQVKVATGKQKLIDKPDVWDSRKIESAQSVLVEYDGPQLDSQTRYYWQVKVWDKNGEPSDWSDITWFETALIESDWNAKWLSAPVLFDWSAVDQRRKRIAKDSPPELPEPAPYFRKEFSIDKKIKSARIAISGLGYYELSVNGEKVGDQVLDPAFTRYDKRVLYSVFDVTNLLNADKNALGVILGNGWYNLTSRGVWGFDHAAWRQPPTFLCQLTLTLDDGSTLKIISDDSWTCAPGPITFNSIRQGEMYDAHREMAGWNKPNFDEKSWHPVRTVRGPEGVLSPQKISPVTIHTTLEPKSITKIQDSLFVVDFGQNMAGFVRLKMQGEEGQAVTFKYAEKLYENGLVDQRNISGLTASTPFQTDSYTFKDNNPVIWQPKFVYHGFQFVEVSGVKRLSKENLTACAVTTSFDKMGSFECSNELINNIQQCTEWSYLNNFVGYPTDCPQREKNGWTGDAHLAAEAGLFNFDPQTAYDKWIQDIADEQQKDGSVAAIIPTAGWGYYWGNGPAWDSAFLLIPWYQYLYSGDKTILEKHYDQMKAYVDFLTTEKSDNGIVGWGLGDWCYHETDTPAEITSTAYYYVDALIISKIALILDQKNEVEKYEKLAKSIKAAFNKKFVDEKKSIVGNNSQTALGCAVYQGMLDAKIGKKLIDELVSQIKKNDYKLDFGILGAKYVLNALAENAHADVAYKMINTTEFPGWGHWIKQGATALWEDWPGASSRNHVMFGDVSAWFYKNLAGIQPDPENPGFKHFFIKPFFPDDMDWVKASYQSPFGEINVYWDKNDKKVSFKFDVPANSSCTFTIPKNLKGSVIAGKPQKIRGKSIQFNSGHFEIELE